MSKAQKIKEQIQFKWKQRKYQLSVFGMTPDFDWGFILVLSAVLIFASSIFNYSTYKNVVAAINEEPVAPIAVREPVTIDEIEKLVSEMKDKKVRFDALVGPLKSIAPDSVGDNVPAEDEDENSADDDQSVENAQ